MPFSHSRREDSQTLVPLILLNKGDLTPMSSLGQAHKKRTGSTTSNRRKRSASSNSLQPAVKRPRTTKNNLPASAVHTFNSQFMKRRGQTQTPHNSNHGHRNSGLTSSRQSGRQSFGGIETLFATKVSRKAATSIKKRVKQRFSHSSIMKRMPNQQHHQQPPLFESSRKTIAARNDTSSVNHRRRNLHHSQRSSTPLDVDDVAAHFAKYTGSKKSTRKNSNTENKSSSRRSRRCSSAKGNSNRRICHSQHQTNQQDEQDEDEQDDDSNPHRHQHANDSDDDVGVPSSQPELNVSGEEEDDAIDALPNDTDADKQETYVYQPPESALFSSKKKKHASSRMYPMSPSATPRHPDASSSSSSSFSGPSITASSNNIGFNPPLAAAPFPSSSSSSSASSSSSSSSSLSRSSSGGSSWHSIVDKSVALSAAGGGKVHRMLAQSPSSALKASSSKWSGRGSSGRGGGKRGGSSNKRGSSWLDRNRNRLRAGKCGELAQQLLDMQEDVSRKVEQLKGLEFQQHNVATTGTSTKNKRRFVSRSDPRSGIFVELQVLQVNNTSTRSGQLVAQCKRTKRIVGGGQKQHQHHRPDHAREQQQNNVELVVNEKRAKEIAIQPGCTLRIFEPWLDVFSSARKHMQSMNSTQSLPDLLVASNLIIKS